MNQSPEVTELAQHNAEWKTRYGSVTNHIRVNNPLQLVRSVNIDQLFRAIKFTSLSQPVQELVNSLIHDKPGDIFKTFRIFKIYDNYTLEQLQSLDFKGKLALLEEVSALRLAASYYLARCFEADREKYAKFTVNAGDILADYWDQVGSSRVVTIEWFIFHREQLLNSDSDILQSLKQKPYNIYH